tara:strand:+ start:589 stop:699 length:111 start_codon:yes stop_codon:yes gene_type:complete
MFKFTHCYVIDGPSAAAAAAGAVAAGEASAILFNTL